MGGSDLRITAGVDGAEDVARAAPRALTPWEAGAKSAGKALKDSFEGAAKDMIRVVTIGNAISFSHAMESANKYRQEIGRLSATNGPVVQLRYQIEGLSRAKLINEREAVSASRSLGRITYDAKGSVAALGALADEAQATGETLTDKLPLGAVLMQQMGVAGASVGDELGRIRSLMDSLGTSGGLLAAEDRFKSMAGLLGEIGAQTDTDKAKIEALVLGIGKGQSAEVGKRSAAAVLGDINKDRRGWERFALGGKWGSLTDANGNLNVDTALHALEVGQRKIRLAGHGNRGLTQQIATNMFGSEQAGAAFLNMNVDEMRRAAATAGVSSKTAAEAAAYRTGDAGKAEGSEQEIERNTRKTAEQLQPVSDYFRSMLGQHPVSGQLGLSVAGSLGAKLIGSILGRSIGGGDSAGGGGAAGSPGGYSMGGIWRALSPAPKYESYMGTAAEDAASGGAGIKAMFTAAGSTLAMTAAAGIAAGLAGWEIGTYLDDKLGISDLLAGTKKHPDTADTRSDLQKESDRRFDIGMKYYRKHGVAVGELESDPDAPDISAAIDAPGAMAQLRARQKVARATADAGSRGGQSFDSGETFTPVTAEQLKEVLQEGVNVSIQVSSDTEHPITVNQSQSGGGIRN